MKAYIFSLFVILLVSCNQSECIEKDTYIIINILSGNIISREKNFKQYIPVPPNRNTKDSIQKRKLNPYHKSTYTIAVVPFFKHTNRELSTMRCNGYEELFENLSNIKGVEKKLDISKIKQNGDTIVPFHKSMITKGRKDFVDMGFDLLFQFSDIVFNKERTKAIVIFSSSTSTLAGSTVLYTLEKQNNKWVITCGQTLLIS